MPLLLYSPKRKPLNPVIGNTVLQYHFDYSSGATVKELVSGVNHTISALSTGTAMWDNSLGQYGLRKTNSDTAYSSAMQLSGNINPMTEHTVSVWFKCSAWNANVNGGFGNLFQYTVNNHTCSLYRDGYSIDGAIYFDANATTIKYTSILPSFPSVTHACWVRTVTGLKFYLNGVLKVTATVPSIAAFSAYNLMDEMRYISNAFVLYDVTVLNKALSATEVNALMNLGSAYKVA